MNEHRLTNEIKLIDATAPSRRLRKHLKMAQSPFVFYRGTAQCFYADLKSGLINPPSTLSTVPLTNIMGDCHASNFGFLTEEGSHGDTVIFAPNDFDDACIGYGHWDMLRFLTSLHLVFDHCKGIVSGTYLTDDTVEDKPVISIESVASAQHAFLTSYLATCRDVVDNPQRLNQVIDTRPSGKLGKMFDKALSRAIGGEHFFDKSTLAKASHLTSKGLKFRKLKDKLIPLSSLEYEAMKNEFSPFMDDEILDIVQRQNAGTGSVNVKRYYFLVGPKRPHTDKSFNKSHIIEVKQQRQAAPLYYFKALSPINRLNPSHLTARCQRYMQRTADLLLDEHKWNKHHWLIRSRHHAKVGIDPIDIGVGKKADEKGFANFANLCGTTLALSHCRGDLRSTLYAQTIVAILSDEDIQKALVNCANKYAKQVIDDHAHFVRTLQAQ